MVMMMMMHTFPRLYSNWLRSHVLRFFNSTRSCADMAMFYGTLLCIIIITVVLLLLLFFEIAQSQLNLNRIHIYCTYIVAEHWAHWFSQLKIGIGYCTINNSTNRAKATTTKISYAVDGISDCVCVIFSRVGQTIERKVCCGHNEANSTNNNNIKKKIFK